MQKFISQPNEQGLYEIARWNELLGKYEPFESFLPTLNEEEAKERARYLNEMESNN